MRVQRVLPRDPTAPAAARAAIGELDGELGWRGGDVRLVASELVTNCVRHSTAARDEPIELCVELERESLTLEVCDRGEGFRLDQLKSPGNEEGLGGFGLAIVARLTDAWGAHGNGHTCVWARFDRGG